jgi:hypothetical protein
MVHVASSWRSRGSEAEDGQVNATDFIGLLFPNFAIFVVLGHMGIIVFWLGLLIGSRGLGLIATSPIFILHFLD